MSGLDHGASVRYVRGRDPNGDPPEPETNGDRDEIVDDADEALALEMEHIDLRLGAAERRTNHDHDFEFVRAGKMSPAEFADLYGYAPITALPDAPLESDA